MSDGHFTATIEVTRTVRSPETVTSASRGGYSRTDPHPTESKREVVDVARLVIRAESLETLREKVGRHIELIE